MASAEFQKELDAVNALTDQEIYEKDEAREAETLKFVQSEPKETSVFVHAPFTLTVTIHDTKEGCWQYSKGTIAAPDREPIIIPRNYHSMWHLFVDHPNFNQYLLLGHDYQGYDCVNLTDWVRHKHLPREAFYGMGFCWRSVEFDDTEGPRLIVNGCFWGGPDDLGEVRLLSTRHTSVS